MDIRIAVPHFLDGNAELGAGLEDPRKLGRNLVEILKCVDADRVRAPGGTTARIGQGIPGIRVRAERRELTRVILGGNVGVDRLPVMETGVRGKTATVNSGLMLGTLEQRELPAGDSVMPKTGRFERLLLNERVEVLRVLHEEVVKACVLGISVKLGVVRNNNGADVNHRTTAGINVNDIVLIPDRRRNGHEVGVTRVRHGRNLLIMSVLC